VLGVFNNCGENKAEHHEHHEHHEEAAKAEEKA
jgi:hypothetical protein